MSVFDEKRANSEQKIKELRTRVKGIEVLSSFKHLAIYTTGSYARGEASRFSDIDLFFVNTKPLSSVIDKNINSVRLFSGIVQIGEEMNFPKFSNDGEYLKILEAPEILKHLGSANDDYMNHFTARLLLILESKPVYGTANYNKILRLVLSRYFEDYPDHPETFRPTFLVNDILRFWKTLCLNYENKRNQPAKDERKRIAQKVKNLKLKFSRMLTCYGSVCYIAAEKGVIGPDYLLNMTKLSPLERLKAVADPVAHRTSLSRIDEEYGWFLDLTNVSEEDLLAQFSSIELRKEAFRRADYFGSALFEITRDLADRNGYLRFLVV